MTNYRKQMYTFMFFLEFPLVAFLRADYGIAIVLTVLFFVAYTYLKPFVYLKTRIEHFKFYFIGIYILGFGSALYNTNAKYDADEAFGLLLLVNIFLLPLILNVKREIEEFNCNN